MPIVLHIVDHVLVLKVNFSIWNFGKLRTLWVIV